MKFPLVPLLLVASLCSCEKEVAPAPQTPDELYAEAQRLLRPHVEGEQSDFAAANRLLHQAAEKGHRQAQTDLGGMYLFGGRGVSPEPREALKWFLRAAEQGNIASHVFIGDIFFYGLGVPKDVKAGMAHWLTAAEGGFVEAQFRLGNTLLAHGEDKPAAIDWLTKAATAPQPSRHSAAAACVLANACAKGNGVPQDMQKAIEWYALAATGGNPKAQQIYAIMLLTGEGVGMDVAKGEALLRLSAGQGYAPAMARLVNWLRNKKDASDAERQEAEAWAKKLNEQQPPKQKSAAATPPQA